MEEKQFDYSELDNFIQDVEELQKKYPHLYICIWNDQKETKGHVRIDADIYYFPEGKKRYHPLEEVREEIQTTGRVRKIEIV